MSERLKVYLAGGMRTDWQSEVMERCSDSFIYIDPRRNGTKEFEEFISWDFLGLEQCDIVFLYLEDSNPAGHASMVEAGYAIGQNKTVIFVNEQHGNKYTRFLEKSPHVIFYENFKDGLEHLVRISRLFSTYML